MYRCDKGNIPILPSGKDLAYLHQFLGVSKDTNISVPISFIVPSLVLGFHKSIVYVGLRGVLFDF